MPCGESNIFKRLELLLTKQLKKSANLVSTSDSSGLYSICGAGIIWLL